MKPNLWRPPADIQPDWTLEHPRVFYTKENMEAARRGSTPDAPPWARRIAAELIGRADSLRWMKLDDDAIRRTTPKPCAYYMYGVTNPVGPDGSRIHPIGWEAPGLVRSESGRTYPDEEHPDDGGGWDDGKGNRYYFVARWNGFVVDEMTRALEPLAYAYAASGDIAYARKAAVILDALAAIYPTAIEGPLDYPGSAPGAEGGRLERPLYQVARTLVWYANATDLIWNSGVLDAPSQANPGASIKENVVHNMLLNGADYCWRESQLPGYVDQLHNGTADYNIGLLAVGSLLGIDKYVAWTAEGPASIRNMIMNNLDRDGSYFETSESYGLWTQELYMTIAELLYRVRTPRWPEGLNLYADPRFARFYVGYRESRSIAGRMPKYGDSGTDDTAGAENVKPHEREWLLRFALRTDGAAVDTAAGAACGRDSGTEAAAGEPQDGEDFLPPTPWVLFHSEYLPSPSLPHMRQAGAERSGLLGGKGIAFLRAGGGARGVMMRFGATLNHGHLDELGLHIYDDGRELSFDPGYGMAHYRYGWQMKTVAHLTVAVDGEPQLSRHSAGGSALSFASVPGLSVAEAADAAAYDRSGVSVYRRLVALVDRSESESYIIDLFRVEGGGQRDYSFHAKGASFASEGLRLSEPAPGSVASGDYDWGRRIQGDGKIADYADESFFFDPPGDGYGFLGSPRRAKPEGVWSAAWTDPGRLKLTMLPAPDREVIVADGPDIMGVKYVLARDSGASPSLFAAVVETGEAVGASRIYPLAIEAGDPRRVAAFAVASADGSQVDYVLSTPARLACTARDAAGHDDCATDAEFAHLRLNAYGRLVHAHMVKGTELRCGRFALITEKPFLEGTVVAVDERRGRLLLKGEWPPALALAGQYGFVEHEAYSRNSAYRIAAAEAEVEGVIAVSLDPGDLTLAIGKLVDDPKDGILPNRINLPYSRNVLRHGPNRYFDGKLVRNDRGASTVIRAVQDDYAAIAVADAAGFRRGDDIVICDVKPGDRFVIPVTVHLQARGEDGYELRAPVAVRIVPPAGTDIVSVRDEAGTSVREPLSDDGYSVIPQPDGSSLIRFRASGDSRHV